MLKKISFITSHFHHFAWTKRLLYDLQRTTNTNSIGEIIVINQDRDIKSRDVLYSYCQDIRVLEYPQSDAHFKVTGHDHAAVLNRAVIEAQGDYICIFDSDAHPFKHGWLDICENLFQNFDAIVAECPSLFASSHPCFMFFKKKVAQIPLVFDQDLFTKDIDTGRLVGLQILNNGMKVYFASPKLAFSGFWGSVYLDCIYHHSSGSFAGGDERLKRQLTWKHKFFERMVLDKNVYRLSLKDLLFFKLLCRLHHF